MIILDDTYLALNPEQHFEHDPTVKSLSDVRFSTRFAATVFRLSGRVFVAALEGDRAFLKWYFKEFSAALKVVEAEMPGSLPFDSQQIKSLEEFDPAAVSNEELREGLIRQLSESHPLAIDQMNSSMQKTADTYFNNARLLRDRCYSIMTDSNQSLLNRLAAAEKHARTIELSLAFASFKEKHDDTLNEFSQATTEVLKAVKDPQYTREDLKALLVRLEQLLKYIEQTTSIAKRIAALIVVF
jgi:DNA repair ATPase RecN